MISIVSTADVHFCPERADDALASLETLRVTAKERRADLVTISGDLWHRGLQASSRDAYARLMDAVRGILEIAPIAAISGTVTHDPPGAYDALVRMQAQHRMTMLEPGRAYYLVGGEIVDAEPAAGARLLLFGIPEPAKSWLLANRNGLGRDEANQAVVDAMKELLLGLGGLRRQHLDLAAALLYHGAVKGARMGSGQTVGSAEIAIGREDLEMVGADYYALGHIHEPQQIEPLPAYYAGSAYPTDWGETTQRSFNVVEINYDKEPHTVRVHKEPYPHAPRCKVEIRAGEPMDIDNPWAGYQTWLVLRGTDEEIGNDGVGDGLLRKILAEGALPGSRVTVERIPVETVRAAEITEAQRLRDKLIVKAEASSGPAPSESVLAKADDLEREGREAGVVPDGQHIRHRSLRLRGSKAIKKGLGADEVLLDFDDLDAGMVALIAPNGSGKTGFLSRLHPFLDTPPRDGFLHEHFGAKDSQAELTWSDERTGTWYRSTILVDPMLSTPKTECHLARGDGRTWEPATDGRQKDYDQLVKQMWGSIDLYLRSVYATQKSTRKRPELGDGTEDDEKALFLGLGGMGRYEWYTKAAKGKADAIATVIDADNAAAGVLRPMIAEEPAKRAGLERISAAATKAKADAESVRAKGHEAKVAHEALEKRLAAQRELTTRIAALDDEARRLDAEAKQIEGKVTAAALAASGREGAAKTIERAETLGKAREALKDEAQKVAAERERLSTQHAGAVAACRAARDQVTQEIRRLEKYAAELERKKHTAVTAVDFLSAEVAKPIDEDCPTCGQKLPQDKRDELRALRETQQRNIAASQEQILGLDNTLMENERERKRQERRLQDMIEPKAPELPLFGQQAALDAVNAELARLNVNAARNTIAAADAACATIAAAKERQEQIRTRIGAIKGERNQLAAHQEPRVHSDYAEAGRRLDGLREQYTAAVKELSRLEAEERAGIAELEEIARKAEQLDEIEARIVGAEAELRDWRYLEKACGRDGIQALELDAMGPSISAEATALLRTAREAGAPTPFDSIRIDTQRVAGKGAKTKVIEDFAIKCHDTRDDTWAELRMISGGESVWLRAAIYQAFGVYRARSTGLRFDLLVLDEADGALDPDARLPYLRMLERGHTDSGRRHTLIVTHSPEMQQAIAQHVHLRDLVVAARKEVAA